jgi:hypothetical protein
MGWYFLLLNQNETSMWLCSNSNTSVSSSKTLVFAQKSQTVLSVLLQTQYF